MGEPKRSAARSWSQDGEAAPSSGIRDGRDRKVSGTRLRRPTAPEQASGRSDSREYRFDSDVDRVSDFVDELLQGRALASDQAETLGLALRELLLNAIEHGNLGFSFEDKASALADGTWCKRLAERAAAHPYRGRAVRVFPDWAKDRVRFTIRDEGRGFDWRSLPDPTDPLNLLRDNGRGVMMAQLSVDELYFNETGNEVTSFEVLVR